MLDLDQNLPTLIQEQIRNRYRTKLVLHTRDSRGDPLIVLSQALALLGSVKLDVIIVAENSAGVKILAGIGSRVKIPIFTLFAAAPSLSFSEHPYLIQIDEDESSQAKGIATVVEAFSWRSVVLIYEDSDSAREILPILITSFEETGARIALHIALLESSIDGKIIEQLKMLMNMHTSVYVVHMSPILASQLFLNAKRLRMTSRGFQGISGGFQLTDGRLIKKEFEIVNVFRGERLIGYWNPENGITSIMQEENHTESNLASSRKLESVIWPGATKDIPKGLSLHRKRLRIGVPIKIGFTELISVIYDPQTNETTVTGFCVEVFKEAIKSLDYEVHYEFIPFADVNRRMAGTYDDLILKVYHKNFDVVVGDITILASRFPFVDFTLPFTDLGVGVIVSTTNKNDIWIFLKPLSGDLWITTGAFFIFIGIVVWLIKHRINDEFQGSPSEQIGTIFCYTATLASMLTVQQIQLISRDDDVGSSADLLLLRGINKSMYGNPSSPPLPFEPSRLPEPNPDFHSPSTDVVNREKPFEALTKTHCFGSIRRPFDVLWLRRCLSRTPRSKVYLIVLSLCPIVAVSAFVGKIEKALGFLLSAVFSDVLAKVSLERPRVVVTRRPCRIPTTAESSLGFGVRRVRSSI
ncbi:hypothetical protein GQ457_09G009150 [Hibiscus cannabinus]